MPRDRRRTLRLASVLAFVFALACGGVREESARPESSPTRLQLSRVEAVAPLSVRRAELTGMATAPALPRSTLHVAAPSAALPPPSAASVERQALLAPVVDPVDRAFPLYGVAFHMQAQVFSEASEKAVVSGYLRRGGQLRVKPGARGTGCDTLWYEARGGGFVCGGKGFAIGKTPQAFSPSPAPPSLYDDLPYVYEKTGTSDLPQYFRLPTKSEEAGVGTQLANAKRVSQAPPEPTAASKSDNISLQAKTPQTPLADIASALRGGAPSPLVTLPDGQVLPNFVRMIMQRGFYVSSDGREALEGRQFVRTVRGAYVRAEAATSVNVSSLHGTLLPKGTQLPLGLAYRPGMNTYTRDALSAALTPSEPLHLMESFPLTSEVVLQAGHRERVARDGRVVPEDGLRIVDNRVRPPLVPKSARWIWVQLSTQTLVAYEGNTPVFATLVSTGKEDHETPSGIFRIQSKHVSTTMDGEVGSDEAYSIEDVPWTMYFSGSVALHAAFWHEKFGRVRSHGCVNLAPADARWLFDWTTPTLPTGFHGVMSTPKNLGTFVVIDP